MSSFFKYLFSVFFFLFCTCDAYKHNWNDSAIRVTENEFYHTKVSRQAGKGKKIGMQLKKYFSYPPHSPFCAKKDATTLAQYEPVLLWDNAKLSNNSTIFIQTPYFKRDGKRGKN